MLSYGSLKANQRATYQFLFLSGQMCRIHLKQENVLRQAVKKWSSAFYFKKFGTTNDQFWGGGVNYQTQIVALFFQLDMRNSVCG